MAGTLNPLSTRHPVLPGNLVLMAKLVVVAALVKGYGGVEPRIVAFLDVVDRLGTAEGYGQVACALVWIGAGLVLVNRVRSGGVVVAAGLLGIELGDVAGFTHGGLYAALLLVLTALWTAERGTLFLRLQVALLYLGAGLNKALHDDWWSGRFLEYYSQVMAPWTHERVAALGWASTVTHALSLGTIVAELVLVVAFVHPRGGRIGLLLGGGLHVGVLLWMGLDYGIFMYVVLASYLVFAPWTSEIRLRGPRDGVGGGALAALRLLDVDGLLRDDPQVAVGSRARGLVVAGHASVLTGLRAWTSLLLRFPPVHLILLPLVAWPGSLHPLRWVRAFALAAIFAAVAFPVIAEGLTRARRVPSV